MQTHSQTGGLGLVAANGGLTDDRATLRKAVLLTSVLTVALLLIFHMLTASDYVGIDNDDVMRLIEVRDLLNGQNWFDTYQYRLGLAGGTQMHWSRLIDLPIAALIACFSLAMSAEAAERTALMIWPVLLTVPVLWATALGCLRLGGRNAMFAGLALTVLFLVAGTKFRPGAIDHHNVQIAVLAVMAAMLVDPRRQPSSYATAGAMAAIAIAIGAETTPIIAVACLVVGLQWVWHGESMRRAAQAFALSLAGSMTAIFFLTIPPRLYAQVTCDNLSLGFYALSLVGGIGLFGAAAALSGTSRAIRLAGALACGGIVLATALVVAPECLRSPLASLDPMLVSLWLDGITETRSVVGTFTMDQGNIGTYYAVGLLGIIVSLYRASRSEKREAYLALAALIGISFVIALIQMRGALFSNFLAIFPLAAVIADLRTKAKAQPNKAGPGIAFAAITLASIPAVWSLAGLLVPTPVRDAALAQMDGMPIHRAACATKDSIAPLATEPAGTVMATSELGTAILRYTPHRVLAAPYHRNQAGMLTELRAGMAAPEEAHRMMKDAGVTLVAYCDVDPQTNKLIALAPNGLYAELSRGTVPDYLAPLPTLPDTTLKLYHVVR